MHAVVGEMGEGRILFCIIKESEGNEGSSSNKDCLSKHYTLKLLFVHITPLTLVAGEGSTKVGKTKTGLSYTP